MHKIWFNGEGYPDPEAMPPEVRRQYEDALRRKGEADLAPSSDVVRMGVWEDDGEGTLEIHTSREIVINGKKYADLDELPAEERKLVQRMMGKFPDLDDVFEDDGFLEMFESRSAGLESPREDPDSEEVVLRSSRMTRAPGRHEVHRAGTPWSSGWAVAFVLAIALLWVLVFGG